jgi:hypothetical protein
MSAGIDRAQTERGIGIVVLGHALKLDVFGVFRPCPVEYPRGADLLPCPFPGPCPCHPATPFDWTS